MDRAREADHYPLIKSATKREIDYYTKSEKIVSPDFRLDGNSLTVADAGVISAANLIAVRDSQRLEWTWQIYIAFRDVTWSFLERAYLADGSELPVTKVDRIVTSTGISEHLAIPVNLAFLENAKTDGINLKLVGKRGEKVVKIPPYFIAAYLERFRELSK